MDVNALWEAIIEQKADILRTFFHEDAYINWHCSNEHFTVKEYIQANCEYPGKWYGEIERVETIDDLTILVFYQKMIIGLYMWFRLSEQKIIK